MSLRWGFTGCGNLAQAIIKGGLSSGQLDASNVFATNRSQDKLNAFSKNTGIQKCTSNSELLSRADVIVLGSKPQDLCAILFEIAPLISANHVVISLAAGVPSDVLKKHLSKARAIARVMANTPAMIQMGLFGNFLIKGSKQDNEIIHGLFSKLGTVIDLKSDKEVDAITAGSASGTGFVFSFLEEFEKWFKKRGLKGDVARIAAIQTFLGTSVLAQRSENKTLKELRLAVTSKKGTTLAGLTSMKKSKVAAGLQRGLDAAFARSIEISKDLRRTRK